VPYNQQKVHQKKYFAELLQKQKKEMPPSMPELLRLIMWSMPPCLALV